MQADPAVQVAAAAAARKLLSLHPHTAAGLHVAACPTREDFRYYDCTRRFAQACDDAAAAALRAASAAARNAHSLRALAAGTLPRAAAALLLQGVPEHQRDCAALAGKAARACAGSRTAAAYVRQGAGSAGGARPRPPAAAVAAMRLLRRLCEDAGARPAAAAAAASAGRPAGAAGLAALAGMLEGVGGPGGRPARARVDASRGQAPRWRCCMPTLGLCARAHTCGYARVADSHPPLLGERLFQMACQTLGTMRRRRVTL